MEYIKQFITYPIKDDGYIIFSTEKPSSLMLHNERLIMCKVDISRIDACIFHGTNILYSKNTNIRNNGSEIVLHKGTCYMLPVFLSCSFVTPCYIELDIFPTTSGLFKTFNTTIKKSTEQIYMIVEPILPYILKNNEFFIGIKIPYPFQYEVVFLEE